MLQNLSPMKIRWACRRGMLELDILLIRYFENVYSKAPLDEKSLFISILECGDHDLYRWLVKRESCEKPEFTQLIQHIIE